MLDKKLISGEEGAYGLFILTVAGELQMIRSNSGGVLQKVERW